MTKKKTINRRLIVGFERHNVCEKYDQTYRRHQAGPIVVGWYSKG